MGDTAEFRNSLLMLKDNYLAEENSVKKSMARKSQEHFDHKHKRITVHGFKSNIENNFMKRRVKQ